MVPSPEFDELWARLRVELNLTESDLDVGYKIVITTGPFIRGYLYRGRVYPIAHWYSSPSSAQKAADAFLVKYPDYKCSVVEWEGSINLAVSQRKRIPKND